MSATCEQAVGAAAAAVRVGPSWMYGTALAGAGRHALPQLSQALQHLRTPACTAGRWWAAIRRRRRRGAHLHRRHPPAVLERGQACHSRLPVNLIAPMPHRQVQHGQSRLLQEQQERWRDRGECWNPAAPAALPADFDQCEAGYVEPPAIASSLWRSADWCRTCVSSLQVPSASRL